MNFPHSHRFFFDPAALIFLDGNNVKLPFQANKKEITAFSACHSN